MSTDYSERTYKTIYIKKDGVRSHDSPHLYSYIRKIICNIIVLLLFHRNLYRILTYFGNH